MRACAGGQWHNRLRIARGRPDSHQRVVRGRAEVDQAVPQPALKMSRDSYLGSLQRPRSVAPHDPQLETAGGVRLIHDRASVRREKRVDVERTTAGQLCEPSAGYVDFPDVRVALAGRE